MKNHHLVVRFFLHRYKSVFFDYVPIFCWFFVLFFCRIVFFELHNCGCLFLSPFFRIHPARFLLRSMWISPCVRPRKMMPRPQNNIVVNRYALHVPHENSWRSSPVHIISVLGWKVWDLFRTIFGCVFGELRKSLGGGFKYFVIFIPTWWNDPIWLIFFR